MATRRSDPTGTNKRFLSNGLSSEVANPDPDYCYVGVWVRDEAQMDRYFALGYEEVSYKENGEYWARSRKHTAGTPEVHNGMLLMRMRRDQKEELETDGAPGICGGIGELERIEDAMRVSKGSFDPLRDVEGVSGLVRKHTPRENPIPGETLSTR